MVVDLAMAAVTVAAIALTCVFVLASAVFGLVMYAMWKAIRSQEAS